MADESIHEENGHTSKSKKPKGKPIAQRHNQNPLTKHDSDHQIQDSCSKNYQHGSQYSLPSQFCHSFSQLESCSWLLD